MEEHGFASQGFRTAGCKEFSSVSGSDPSLSPPAVIAGCAVCLMFAVLLILLLIYRMKKKDEGSYELGKKPIYKKAPTTEIYA